ncbi:MAG: ABC transporter ATP-binding protein, partial [Dehalococcoidia bacterium]
MVRGRSDNSAGRERGAGFEPAQPGGSKALWRALCYLRSYRRDATGALIALLLVTAANLVAPQFIRLAIDRGLVRRDATAVLVAVCGLIGVAAGRGLFNFLQGYLAERASQGVAFDLREALFAQIQRLSFSYYDQVQTGQLLTRLTNDVEQIRTFAGAGIVQLAASAIMLFGSAILLFILNWRLAIVALATIPPIFVLLYQFVGKVAPLFGRVQQSLGRLNSILQEDLAGIRVIRAFAREAYESRRYGAANEVLLDQNVATVQALSNNFPFVFFFGNVGTLAVVWYGGLQSIGGHLSIGELIAFNTYLTLLLQPVLSIGFLAAGISRAGASSLRVFEVLDAAIEVQDKPDATSLPPVTGQVEFRDVHFRYPGGDREILRGLSFTVQPRQRVAILGTTGSGKSTVVNLLPRFYDV